MKKVTLGNTGIEVSRVGFGVLPIGPSQLALPTEAGAEIIKYAFRHGINFIDTAQYYRAYPYMSKAFEGGEFDDIIICSKSLAADYDGMMDAIEDARRQLNRDLFVYTAREDRICACVWLLSVEKPSSPAFPDGKTGFVMNVYTDPAYRRQGLATRLMNMMLDEAKEMGLDMVELKATDAGYPVYKKVGFQDAVAYHRPMIYRWEKEE